MLSEKRNDPRIVKCPNCGENNVINSASIVCRCGTSINVGGALTEGVDSSSPITLLRG